MNLYIYTERIPKEILCLPNEKTIALPFLSLVNALIPVSYLQNNELRSSVHAFYSGISNEVISYLRDQEQNLMNELSLISERSKNAHTTAYAASLLRQTAVDYEMYDLGMDMQKHIDSIKSFEATVNYDKYANEYMEKYNISKGQAELLIEIITLKTAIQTWLIKSESKLKPTKRFAMFDSLKLSLILKTNSNLTTNQLIDILCDQYKVSEDSMYPQYTYNMRSNQFHAQIAGIETKKIPRYRDDYGNRNVELKNTFSRLYTSDMGLLPLVWAEITYAIENDIFLRQCKACEDIYIHQSNTSYCPSCKRSMESNKLEYDRLRKRKERAEIEDDKHKIQQKIDNLLKGE